MEFRRGDWVELHFGGGRFQSAVVVGGGRWGVLVRMLEVGKSGRGKVVRREIDPGKVCRHLSGAEAEEEKRRGGWVK